jgi:CysZ protein
MDLIKKAVIDFTVAFRYLRGPKFWYYIILTGIIGLFISAVLLYIAYRTGAYMSDFLSDLYPFEFGKKAAFTFFHLIPITYILAVIILKYVTYIVLSPIMFLLSIKIEEDHCGSEIKDDNKQWYYLIRTFKVTGRSIYKEILWTILFSLVGILIPVVGIGGILITQAYYIGYAHLDYTLSRKLEFKHMKVWMKRNRGLALGNGIIYFTLLLIPVLGLFLAPVFSTAAASIGVNDLLDG